ncbi:uncharacterized protein P884DRAFT_177073, partial [Thermothelomyces heterothallicus CBS 202.75]|uniref:uncharacterized protein n=1 Tax=Thermothelomyces heterothallicus CBS 202.75 TaxID=1149848 RepID=UPI00374387E5
RELRKEIKPEMCPVCAKGHSYINDVKRDIAANHADVAAKYGVSTERHVCEQCQKNYARKDHLVRH